MSGDAEAAERRWASGRRVTAVLLAIWAGVTFGVTYFARELDRIAGGWPFSFWAAAQGALLVYLLLVCLYAAVMRRLDLRHGFAEDD